MSLDVAIVADDLTGALDTATPFALAGRRVVVALRHEAAAEAIASGADVIAISTASRAIAVDLAAQRVRDVGMLLAAAHPAMVFKKIDSRLKGNVGVETYALAGEMGFRRAVIAPAIPDQQRPTIDSAVTGRGVGTPLPIKPLFNGFGVAIDVADAKSDDDLDRIVAGNDWSQTLAVGARGLGIAFARRYAAAAPSPMPMTVATLMAIGSHDPLTTRQIEVLRAQHPALTVIEAAHGRTGATAPRLPALLHSTGDFMGPDEAISDAFSAAVARSIAALRPDSIVLSGGDTALAVLERLGVRLVFPKGEAAPGLPWFLIEPQKGHSMSCVVKSGGFGDETVLAGLLPAK